MAMQEWRKGTFVTAAELGALAQLAKDPMDYVVNQKDPELAPLVFAFRGLLTEIQRDIIDERRSGT